MTVTAAGVDGATSVRLCTRAPGSLVEVRAPGTFRYRGSCIAIPRLRRGGSASFRVSAFPSARGALTDPARATAIGVPHPARDAARVIVVGPAVACPARDQTASAPTAHAAC